MTAAATATLVSVPAEGARLDGSLSVPSNARGIVLFAHGSGSSRLSPRNAMVAGRLHDAGLGTLLFDLLTTREDTVYERRFDIPLLAARLHAATDWVSAQPSLTRLPLGFFGASTGAAAALVAAADVGARVRAVVSRGGRPDLAGEEALRRVVSPVLLIVGGYDPAVIQLNREALRLISAEKELTIVPGATHLFEEPGALEEVASLATAWFERHMGAAGTGAPAEA